MKMWKEIHDYKRNNDVKQLMTLLSKHTINLNSFNLSTDGDTILHSAANSNNVKMMEFILQSLSPSTKQRMIKMKNKNGQLATDLLTAWAPSIHSLFPEIQTSCGTPYYPQTHFYKLPKDLLFLDDLKDVLFSILQFIIVKLRRYNQVYI
jgi:ankyrin repeat protein